MGIKKIVSNNFINNKEERKIMSKLTVTLLIVAALAVASEAKFGFTWPPKSDYTGAKTWPPTDYTGTKTWPSKPAGFNKAYGFTWPPKDYTGTYPPKPDYTGTKTWPSKPAGFNKAYGFTWPPKDYTGTYPPKPDYTGT